MSTVLPSTAAHLDAAVAAVQRDARVPSLAAAVVRDGAVVWFGARGRSVRDGSEDRATPDTQYRVGSITKTFTAALVLQLREEGALDLTDPVGAHVPEGPFSGATLRGLLAHHAGLPAEPAGAWWERSRGGSYGDLLDANADRSPVLPAGERYHYSNLAFAILARVVEGHRGVTWWEAVRSRILEPLRMDRTTYHPAGPHADGYSVEALTGALTPEPHQDTGAMAPAGQLWSTPADLAIWAHELARPDPRVLTPESVTAMCTPQSADPAENLAGAYGLGLRLAGPGPRMLVGHTGSMPGFLSGLFVDRGTATGAVLLANTGYGLDVEGVPRCLIETVLTHEPKVVAEWMPTPSVDDSVRDLLGTWYWGNAPFTMSWDRGRLCLRSESSPRGLEFTPTGDDTWIGHTGYQTAEVMTVVRRDEESVSHLDIGTFCYTRVPYDPTVPVPGAGDERQIGRES